MEDPRLARIPKGARVPLPACERIRQFVDDLIKEEIENNYDLDYHQRTIMAENARHYWLEILLYEYFPECDPYLIEEMIKEKEVEDHE